MQYETSCIRKEHDCGQTTQFSAKPSQAACPLVATSVLIELRLDTFHCKKRLSQAKSHIHFSIYVRAALAALFRDIALFSSKIRPPCCC